MYNEKTLEEIAGFDEWQIRCVLGRPRDKNGKLQRVHENNGKGVVNKHVGFKSMFMDVWEKRGASEKVKKDKWQQFLDENPSYVLLQNKMESLRAKSQSAKDKLSSENAPKRRM